MNNRIREKLTDMDPKDSKNMFGQIKKNFKKFNPLNLQELKIPKHSESLLVNSGINPLSLEMDILNNYIVDDQVNMLDTIGAFLESVHAHKQIDEGNIVHTQVSETFNRFLETKLIFESNNTTLTNFCDVKLSDNLEETQSCNFFITKKNISYIFSSLRNKLSSGVDNVPNIVLKKSHKK